MTKKYKIRKIQTFLFILGLDIVVFKNIAFAFVPYVYEPKLEKFKEDGIFNVDTAISFRDNILSQGNRRHPMDLYKSFRGREPEVEHLLKRDNLI